MIQQLAEGGFTVSYVEKAAEALARIARERTDVVVAEFSLPDMSGSELCRRLRTSGSSQNVALMFVSARSDEIDRVLAFELGADDYVVKPASGREVMLRVRAMLRRRTDQRFEQNATLEADAIHMRAQDRAVMVDEKPVHLTGIEFALLAELVRNRGFVLTRDILFERVWGRVPGGRSRTVDTHMKRLRQKLGDAATSVETVRGVGYRFRGENVVLKA